MEIKREIFQKLKEWKDSGLRRPLIIQGARQIGKTWVMKRFGRDNYKHVAYFNFDDNNELAEEFRRTKQPERLLARLRLYTAASINPAETLIIFDEIQECPEALNSLKYFCEDVPEYHIMAAGSLLGVAIHHHTGFPVGKVDFLKMYPVSFKEYISTLHPPVAEYLDNLGEIEELPAIIEGQLWEAFRAYQICGGMPKAVLASLENMGNGRIVTEQNEILTSFFLDFSKHAPTNDFAKIAAVWQSLPSQLAKENRKFIYKVVRPGARAREYERALDWLREAGLIYQIFCCNKPALPLSAYDDPSAFKIYMFDSGLLLALSKVPPEIFVSDQRGLAEFMGALTENIILQSLVPQFEQLPRYWVSNGTAEVDFIIQDQLQIIPAEVKASDNTASKSLAVYMKKFSPEVTIIYSAKPLNYADTPTGKVLHIPLPLACWTSRILALCAPDAP